MGRAGRRHAVPHDAYELILQLQVPLEQMPGEKESTMERLGMLYAGFVSTVRPYCSPGLMSFRSRQLSPGFVWELQRRFQVATRYYLEEVRRGVLEGKLDGKAFTNQYFPESFPTNFARGSVEATTRGLAEDMRFTDIGEAVRKGAEEYHKYTIQAGMPRYRTAEEYRRILDALRERA